MGLDLSQLSPDILRLNPALAKQAKAGRGRASVADPRLTVDGITFRSLLEARAWREVEEWAGFKPAILRYEALALRLPGGLYTPDFYLRLPLRPDITLGSSSELWLVEVKSDKQFKAYQSGRSARRALREAATVYADLAWFFLLTPANRGWLFERVQPQPGRK